MTVDEIKELIQVVNESGIAELEVQKGEDRVRIRRATSPSQGDYVLSSGAILQGMTPATALPLQPGTGLTQSVTPVAAGVAGTAAGGGAAGSGSAALTGSAATAEAEKVYVKSPIVGTFYEAGSPGAAAFVKVGDRVTPGQVLCIIESMKLMNEIECEVTGTIVAKLVENGRPVEYGESLFAVQPS